MRDNMKTETDKTEDFPKIMDEILEVIEKNGYQPEDTAGFLLEIVIQMTAALSKAPLKDANEFAKTITAEIKELVKMKSEGLNQA
jgi:hypothetical protein